MKARPKKTGFLFCTSGRVVRQRTANPQTWVRFLSCAHKLRYSSVVAAIALHAIGRGFESLYLNKMLRWWNLVYTQHLKCCSQTGVRVRVPLGAQYMRLWWNGRHAGPRNQCWNMCVSSSLTRRTNGIVIDNTIFILYICMIKRFRCLIGLKNINYSQKKNVIK